MFQSTNKLSRTKTIYNIHAIETINRVAAFLETTTTTATTKTN